MKGDAKVIELLNVALKNELTAINQYFLHYRLLDHWGVERLAKFEYGESLEEEALPPLREGIAHCETVRDFITRDLLKDILANEEEHVDTLERQFDMIRQMGLENYIQLQSKPTED